MSHEDKQGGMSVEGANIQQRLALEIRKYQTVRGEQPAGTNERLLSDALAALRSASSSCAPSDEEIRKTIYAYEGALSEAEDDQEGLEAARNNLLSMMQRLRSAACAPLPESGLTLEEADEANARWAQETSTPCPPAPAAPTPRVDALVSAQIARAGRGKGSPTQDYIEMEDLARQLEASRSASAEPDGYAALLDDKHAPKGFWWAGVWHDEGNAKVIAEKGKQGARIVPVWLAPRSSIAATVPAGWKFQSADFSMPNSGRVIFMRDAASQKLWFSLTEEEQDRIPLYVWGEGATFEAAMEDARKNVLAAPVSATEASKP